MSDYGQGIEPRLRDHYVGLYGEAYWKDHRSQILADVLARTRTNTQRTAKYTSKERRHMTRNPWEYPEWTLREAAIPEEAYRQWFDPDPWWTPTPAMLERFLGFVQSLIG